MPDHRNEQSKTEIQIATYREIALIVREPETLKFIEDRIAYLERKLRGDRSVIDNLASPNKTIAPVATYSIPLAKVRRTHWSWPAAPPIPSSSVGPLGLPALPDPNRQPRTPSTPVTGPRQGISRYCSAFRTRPVPESPMRRCGRLRLPRRARCR